MRSPDIQGVLGQWFLAQFDYVLDLHAKRIEFGKQERRGRRIQLQMINARPIVSTSLGNLALDSGVVRVILFGVGKENDSAGELRTLAGSERVGTISNVSLSIAGRRIWSGEAVAIPHGHEQGVDGLMPLNLFKTVYVCNSEGYAVLE